MKLTPSELTKIVDNAWKVIDFENSHQSENWDSWHLEYSQLANEFVMSALDNSKIGRLFSESDLHEILNTAKSLVEDPATLTKEQLADFLSTRLGKIGDYKFYFPLEELFGLTNSYTLGFCKVLDLEHVPEKLRNWLVSKWKSDFDSKLAPRYIRDLKEYEKIRERVTYLSVEIEAGGSNKAIALATRLANQALNIYKCVYATELSPLTEYIFLIGKSIGWVEGKREHNIVHSHFVIPDLEAAIELVSEMVMGKKHDEVSEHVVSAIDVYGLSHDEVPTELKFVLRVFALEGLLAGKEDKDFVGWKLREKVALLLGGHRFWIREYLGKRIDQAISGAEVETHRVDARRELAKKVAAMYELRSLFAHASGELKERIKEEDYRFADMIFRLTLQVVLRLYLEGAIRHISKEKGGAKSLDWMLESLKYAQQLPLKE